MAHKVHPKSYRIRETKDWDSRGYYDKDTARYLEEDFRIREFLRKRLGKIGIEKIEIERSPNKINIIISSARPGLIIGRGGEGVEQLKRELEQKVFRKVFARKTNKEEEKAKERKEKSPSFAKALESKEKEIRIEIREVRNPWTSANLSAQWVAQQIEKRVRYRRVLKQALSKMSPHKEIKGARIEVSGRLDGREIARREWVSTGRLPRQTLRADIDYAKAEAYCTYGVIGIKVWMYKGEKF
jgi:small subunit ribosomal protein S3